MPDATRLFIVDGYALAFRSFYAFLNQKIRNSRGEELGAVFGFATTLVKILDGEKPDYFAVTFDPPGPTHRHLSYPQYKATRQKMPDEMREQLPRLMQVTDALGVPKITIDGYEADDVMATIALQAEAQGIDVFLVTADKDFGQIVNDRIKMFNLRERQSGVDIIDAKAIEEKFGVPPAQMRDLLALMGDTSDNVPGVRKVGPKTAATLLKQYGSLDGVYEHIAEIKGKTAEYLAEDKENAYLSRDLVTFSTDVDYGMKIDDMRWKGVFPPAAGEVFKELEFKTLLSYVTEHREGGEEEAAAKIEKHYEAVTDQNGLLRLLALLRGAKSFCFDTETTSQNPVEADLVGFSFSIQPGRAYWLPVEGVKGLDRAGVIAKMKPLMEDANIGKTGQNLKYDIIVLRRAGIEVRGAEFDTMIASYVIDPGARSHGIDFLCLRYLDYKKIPTSELIGTGRTLITMDMVPLEQITEYACEDADYALRLRTVFEPELKKAGTEELFHELEMPLMEVLVDMEWAGIAIDTAILGKLSVEMQGSLERLQVEIHREAGGPFNINSPQQLGEIFFEKLKIHEALNYKPKKTPTGQWRTDIDVLEALQEHPLPKLILTWRQLSKLKSTYIDALPRMIFRETGRVHGSFNQTVAATGRLSSTDPNLQNIPVRTEQGREIRKAFVPGPGYECLLSADYSQIELRIAAHYSQDPAMITAFKSGADIHRETAAKVFGIATDAVTREQRDFAKRINFGILYGMGPQRFRQETGVSLAEAKQFIDTYLTTFSGIKQYMERTLASALETGYVSTIMGRRRYLAEELASNNPGVRAQAENKAINTPIQGSAADIIKRAMIDIHADMRREGFKSRMILQVHDELLFEVAPGELEALRALVVRRMEGAADLSVPLVADTGHGANWLEAH